MNLINIADFVWGKIFCADPCKLGEFITDWSQWEKYKDMSGDYCDKCAFAGYCGRIKRSNEYKTIN